MGRQFFAVGASGSRADALRAVTTPTLVMHGSADTLITPSGGERTAELIPGARFELIDGMGHDYPPQLWDTWVDLVCGHIRGGCGGDGLTRRGVASVTGRRTSGRRRSTSATKRTGYPGTSGRGLRQGVVEQAGDVGASSVGAWTSSSSCRHSTMCRAAGRAPAAPTS